MNQLIRFLFVGGCASVVHFTVVSLLVFFGIPPLHANVYSFVCSFQVSYFGHSYLSFSGHGCAKKQSMPKFLCTSVLGFGINQLLFWGLLTATALPYQMALIITLGLTAIVSFFLCRLWAFKAAATL